MELRAGYKQTEVGVIPGDWDVALLGDNAIKVGSGITPKGGSSVYKESGRPFMRSQNVGWGTLKLNDIAFIDEDTHASFSSSEIKQADVLLNITGASIGRCALATPEISGGNVNQHVCIIRTKDKLLDAAYLCRVLLSDLGQGQIDSFQAGGNREGLNFGQIKSFNIPLPPTKTEQTAIANALSDADAWIQSLTRLIAKKRQIKQGAMQTLLTGAKRLPGFEQQEGYKDTDLGKAPKDWEVKLLPEIVTFIHGKAHEQFIVSTAKYEVVNSKFVSTEGRVKKYSSENFCRAKSKDILMVLSDLPNGRALAKCFYVEINEKYAVNQRVCIYRTRKDNSKYLYYILNRNPYFLNLDDGVTQTHILNDDIKRCQLLVPTSVEEQKATATILTDMDAEITALEFKLSKAQQLKQGMMQNLLTGSIRLV